MIKGAQKQMIVVKTPESHYFDEAYFVLRREIRPQKQQKQGILAEANRILSERFFRKDHPLWAKCKPFLLFFLGGLLGGAVGFLLSYRFFS